MPLSDQALGKPLRGKQIDGDDGVPAGVVHVGQQLVAGDARVVDQDVGAAVVVLAQVLGDPVDGVVGGDVERQRGAADLGRGLAERLGRAARRRRTTTLAPSRANTSAMVAPMPRAAPVTNGDLAVERLVPVGGWGGVGRADVEHLAVDVGRLRRQQEPQRGLEARRGGFGVGGQVHQLHRGAAPHLLAERAGEALQRALGDPLVDAARLARGWCRRRRRVRDGPRLRSSGVKNSYSAFRPAGSVMPVASNTSPPNESAQRPPRLLADHVVVLGERGAQRLGDAALAADQQRAGQRRLACAVAAQRLGLRDAELLGEERAGRRSGRLARQVGSHELPFVSRHRIDTNLLQSKKRWVVWPRPHETRSRRSHSQQQPPVAILGGNRIPFARSDGAYANASNQDMFTAALDGLVDRFDLAGEQLGVVVGGAVLKHSRDFNLMRECVLGSALSPYTPAFDLQQACGTGLQATIAAADGIAAGRYEVGRRGRRRHHLRCAHRVRRRSAPCPARAAPRSKSNVDRLKLVGKLPGVAGRRDPGQRRAAHRPVDG